MTPAHLVAVTTWVDWVTQGTGQPSGTDPEAAIKTRAVMLGEKYPDTRMFTQASAAFVALECGLMALPSVGILGKFLEKWWSKNKPALPQLNAPGEAELNGADLPGADRAMLRSWLQDCTKGERSEAEMTTSLSVIRRYAPKGYHWLLNARLDASMRAADIAVRKGWLDAEHQPGPPSEAEIEAVAQRLQEMRALRLPALPNGVGAPSEPFTARVPPPALPAPTPPPRPLVRPSGALEGEQLQAVRMNNPHLRAIAERASAAPADDDDWTPSYRRAAS